MGPPRGLSVKVVGVTGMPGSGKSEAMQVATARGYPVVRMGDMIWEEVDRQGLPRDSANVGKVANAMRESEGPDVWALRTIDRVRTLGASHIVLIDGVRSNHEVEVFRRELGDDFVLVAVHTDARHRFDRLTNRARDDDPTGADADVGHKARDEREMAWGIARTIALADEMIVNDDTLEIFKGRVAALLDELD